jgi:choline dehydrogenase-like flavoprotein
MAISFSIKECGFSARMLPASLLKMGHDPKTSLLNKWNQLHLCKNVFVTDGACMTSTATQNPSLTYMALTARAADFAVSEMKKGNL